jgi:CHRD domain-containing protein
MNQRSILIGAASALVAGTLISCGGGSSYGGSGSGSGSTVYPAIVRSASLDQAQESPTPPVASTATGRGAVVVDPGSLTITGGITFAGLTGNPNGAHIHRGNTTIAIALDIASDNATATVPPGTTMSAADYAELLAGTLYFNVHTVANPNGEIRGNITGTTGVTAGLANLDAAQETPPTGSTATGKGTIVFDSTTGDVLIAYVTHNVANTTVAHIHTGAPGVSGPANVISLVQGTNIYTAPVPTSIAAHLADINAGNTYFNVHSTNNLCPPAVNCGAGEIRGQIVIQ